MNDAGIARLSIGRTKRRPRLGDEDEFMDGPLLISSATSQSERPARILIIDDEEPIRDVLMTALSSSGYEVAEAGDGTIGMEMIVDFRPDLIVLDVMMPGANGYEVADLVRTLRPDTPVLFISAVEALRETAPVSEMRHAAFVAKPFGLDELSGKVKELLATA